MWAVVIVLGVDIVKVSPSTYADPSVPHASLDSIVVLPKLQAASGGGASRLSGNQGSLRKFVARSAKTSPVAL